MSKPRPKLTSSSDRLATFKISGDPRTDLDAAMEVLERLLRSKRPTAALELLDVLHGRSADEPERRARLALTAVQQGVALLRVNGLSFHSTFAEACCLLKRVDVLRSIALAGAPPCRHQAPFAQPAPKDSADWLLELQTDGSGWMTTRPNLFSLSSSWTHRPGFPVLEAIRLGLEVYPELAEAPADAAYSESAKALIRQERMRLRIEAETSDLSHQATAPAAQTRRRL